MRRKDREMDQDFPSERINCLCLRYICEKFTPDKMAFFDLVTKNALHITKV